MKQNQKLVSVAVPGPFKRTFTYHLPPLFDYPLPGQRLLVEFGRQRTVGFCTGKGVVPKGIVTKPILELLDNGSYFPHDLFLLCTWIAEYYFANPADCLAAALPPILKTRKRPALFWGEKIEDVLPDYLRNMYASGERVSSKDLQVIKSHYKSGVNRLITNGVIQESWPDFEKSDKTQICGYSCCHRTKWDSFFQRKKFRPSFFEGEKKLQDIFSEGWTDYYLKQAKKNELIKPILKRKPDSILEFVKPKEGLSTLKLNNCQKDAVEKIGVKLKNGFRCTLLHGITGSGKTLVYCHLARKVLKDNRQVLVMTPEIALSGATLSYFRGFFGESVTVIHSAMTARERWESFSGIHAGRYRIIIGPRSALFAPADRLGLIIVDEEHDGSYKQSDPAPRFHGRDSAIMRAKLADIPVLLGSASPSIESYHHATTGRYDLVELSERPEGATLPAVSIVNMQSNKIHGSTPYLSFPLKKQIDEQLDDDSQVILFLNRRGYAPQLKCSDCGEVATCPDCDIKLTYHKPGKKLTCHYCGYVRNAEAVCLKCSGQLLFKGAGTQKVEEHISRLFKKGRVLRFDSDTASGRKNGHQLLHQFANREYNLLLGTQMVTKGLDLPGVSLVGVLSADQGLDLPDFRSNEKTFSRLLQVSGRSGRSGGKKKGEVYIQTFYPENEVIQDAAAQDYKRFFIRELASRKQSGFPPYSRLLRILISSSDVRLVERSVRSFADQLKMRASSAGLVIDIMGPARCPISLLRRSYRWHLLIKSTRVIKLVRLLSDWRNEKKSFGLPAGVKFTCDVDPDDMM